MSKRFFSSPKQWPKQSRPRERLQAYGAQQLSDVELLAIVLRCGSKNLSVLELSEQILKHYGSLNAVLDASWPQLQQFSGVGLSKYSQLMAVKELGKRYAAHQLEQPHLDLYHSQNVLQYLRLELLQEQREVIAVLCLDADLRKICFEKLFFGSLYACEISINQILRFAITQQASALILAHNHPQGKAIPSSADLKLTQQLQQACQLVEIQLVDHWIISHSESFSFAEQKLLDSP